MQYRFLTGSYAVQDEAGVCMACFDAASGFDVLRAGKGYENPSFVLPHPNGRVFYAVAETAPGAVCVGRMEDLSRSSEGFETGGAYPCHLALSTDGRSLYAANYGSGSLAAFALDESGGIIKRADVRQHSGQGPNPERQESAHVHFSVEIDGRVYACDLGLDAIVVYRNAAGVLDEVDRIPMPAGSGPRHLACNPRHPDWLYCVAELDSRVYALNRETGGWRRAQSVSTLPEGFAGDNTAAAIHLTPAGTLLLASNRGHDSIAVFPVQSDGTLGRPVISRCVAQPRDFLICCDDVLVASQRDSVIRAYRLNPTTLRLEDTGMGLEIGHPVCLYPLF